MNRPELYKRTVDILFQAYFKDELEHQNCYACAVGNLVAANMGYTMMTTKGDMIRFVWKDRIPFWDAVFVSCGDNEQSRYPDNYKEEAKVEIDSTGYRWRELAMIEESFEKAYTYEDNDEEMFNGLCNVLETLKQIHQVEDNTEDVSRFQTHYSSKKQKHEQTGAL